MSAWDALRHRLHVLLHPRDYDRELAREREFHLALDAMHREHDARGTLSELDARAAARRRYGNLTTMHEASRHMAGLSLYETLLQDLRFALRSFRRSPGFTIVAVLTLAIGIGANTAIFSAVNALLLRPLPFAQPERLLKVSLTRPAIGERPANDDAIWSWPKYAVFRDNQKVFSGVAIHSDYDVTLRAGDAAERIRAEMTSGPYFGVLGVAPARGRVFAAEEDQVPNGPKVVMLSDALFTSRFNADSSVIGTALRIDGESFTIVGVMPPGFRGVSGRAMLWVPILAVDEEAPKWAWSHGWSAIARLAPGVSAAQAKSETIRLGGVVDRAYPEPEAGKAHGAVARELDALRVDTTVRRSLYILTGAVVLVLLIACANVANLFLVRAQGRRHEIAVRLAIGATRARLVRQLLTESLLLSLLGGLLGIAVAWASARFLATIDPTRAFNVRSLGGIGAVGLDGIRIDPVTLLVATGLVLVTGILFGLVPAIQATRGDVHDELRRGRSQRSGFAWRMDTRNLLVAVEVALALVLLSGAGLMTRSLGNLMSLSPGFRTEQLLTMRLNTPEGAVRDSTPAFYQTVMDRLATLPSVTAVTMQDCPPLNGGCNGTVLWRHDVPEKQPGRDIEGGVHWITPNWPTTMNVRLLRGRLFDESDRPGARRSVLLSETAARRLFPAGDALEKLVGVGQGGFDSAYVVGVIDDVRYVTIDSAPVADFYLPHRQSPRGRMMLMVQTSGDPEAIIPSVRAAIREVAPAVPLYDVRTMASRVADSTAFTRFATMLLTFFAIVALTLAAIGVYGVIAFSVSQRTREIGIRMALGAGAGGVVRMIVRQGLAVATVGAVVGLAVAVATTSVLGSMLYQVAPRDPATFAGIVALLLAVVALASWIPARRAARIQPTEALREE